MTEHLPSSDAISLENHMAGGPNPQWGSLSEASSLLISPEHWQALEARVLEWFEERGVHMADPEGVLQSNEDRYKRSLSLRSSTHINYKPTLSKRVKRLSHLHINIEYQPAGPNKMTDSC